jgi:hypothetical protein
MSEAVGGVAKMCTICGTDVANKPRTKDAKGRYVCKECVERAQQAKAAKAQAEAAPVAVKAGPKSAAEVQAGDNSFLLDLAKPEIPKGKVMCPSCGKAMSEEAVICVSCGFNKTKNEKLHVQVLKPKIEKATKMQRQATIEDRQPMITGIVTLLITLGCGALAWGDSSGGGAFVALLVLRLIVGGVGVWIRWSAFEEGLLPFLMCLFVPFYDMYFVYFKSGNSTMKWLYPVMWVGVVMFGAVRLHAAGLL